MINKIEKNKYYLVHVSILFKTIMGPPPNYNTLPTYELPKKNTPFCKFGVFILSVTLLAVVATVLYCVISPNIHHDNKDQIVEECLGPGECRVIKSGWEPNPGEENTYILSATMELSDLDKNTHLFNLTVCYCAIPQVMDFPPPSTILNKVISQHMYPNFTTPCNYTLPEWHCYTKSKEEPFIVKSLKTHLGTQYNPNHPDPYGYVSLNGQCFTYFDDNTYDTYCPIGGLMNYFMGK